MQVQYVKVELYPESHMPTSGVAMHNLRVVVKVDNSREFSLIFVRPDDDMTSNFDWIWEQAGRRLKESIGEVPVKDGR